MPHRWILAACLLFPSLVPSEAEARGLGRALRAVRVAAGVAKVYGRASTGEVVLTTQELADCIRRSGQVDAGDAALAAERAELDTGFEKIDALGAAVERSAATVDEYDAVSVDNHNAKVSSYRRQVKAYEKREAEFNARVVEHNGVVTSYNAACYGKSYYEDDYSSAAALASQ